MDFLTEAIFTEDIDALARPDKVVVSEYSIRASECDMHDLVHTDVIFSIMQEAANFAAIRAGIDAVNLDTIGSAWVLSRMSLRLKKNPAWKDTVRIYTWQSGLDRANFFRDFYLYTEAGEPLGSARSAWNLVSATEHKLVSPAAIVARGEYPWIVDYKVAEKDPKRLRANFADFTDANITQRTPGYSDVDRLGHVNNTRYIAMCRDAADELGVNGILRGVDINYVSEIRKGQEISLNAVKVAETAERTKVAVKASNTEDRDYFRAILTFQTK